MSYYKEAFPLHTYLMRRRLSAVFILIQELLILKKKKVVGSIQLTV
jgi:hypothetical protein